jgi:hypothetical protein
MRSHKIFLRLLHSADITVKVNPMELKIASEVLRLADRCTQGHRCLNGMLSEPLPQMSGPQRFICIDTAPCAYKFPFGNNFFCTCPVRRAIYDAYGQ